jgi:HSP90 family molecular chaperone
MDGNLDFARSAERMDNNLSPLWGALLKAVINDNGKATLCLNAANPLIQQMARLDPSVLQPFIRLLYIQALLMGNNQITASELNLLADGFGSLLQYHAQRNEQTG